MRQSCSWACGSCAAHGTGVVSFRVLVPSEPTVARQYLIVGAALTANSRPIDTRSPDSVVASSDVHVPPRRRASFSWPEGYPAE